MRPIGHHHRVHVSGGDSHDGPQELDTDQLLERAGQGDPAARQQLLVRHRQRLRQMVALRMDRRLAARVDPSDVAQETLAEAICELSDYLRRRPLPFYPWLRQLAWERLVDLHGRHVRARRRCVRSASRRMLNKYLFRESTAEGCAAARNLWQRLTPEPRQRADP